MMSEESFEQNQRYEPSYEKRLKERQIIKEETRGTILIALAILFSTLCLGVIAYHIEPEPQIDKKTLETVYDVLNIVVIMMMVIILAVRRTIYYSSRFIKEDFTLTQVLQKWRTIDIVLLAAAETIPIMGLIITLLGMPFNRTFHFFVASGLLIIILMPIGLKVRSKLAVLRKQSDWE